MVFMRRGIGLVLVGLAVLSPRDARAVGAVAGRQGETVTVSAARVAVATTPGRTTLWAQVAVAGAGTGFVWIVPVRAGARIDLGSDAWLDALDAATSPVVLPPSTGIPNTCDAGLAPQRPPPVASTPSGLPTATGVFADAVSLQSFVTGAGFAIPPDLATALEPVFARGAVFASTYATASQPVHTVRVVDSGPPLLPFALTGAQDSTPATAFVMASAGATAGSAPLTLDPSLVTWIGDGDSNLAQARDQLLDPWQGTRWLTESAAPGLLFEGAVTGSGAPLPSVLGQYFSLASAYGDVTGDPAGCLASAASVQTDSDPYVAACPTGTLGVVPGPSPCAVGADDDASTSADGGTPIEALSCGGSADDAALAVAGLAPSSLWISRIQGVITSTSAADVPLSIAATPPTSPVLTAGGYAGTCLELPVPSSTATEPVWAPPAPTASLPPSQSSSNSSASIDAAGATAEGCSAALDSCASSQSTDDEDDSDSSCSGDSSGDGSDGGSCSGGDASSSNDCTAARGGHRPRGRSPVSRVLMTLVAGLAIVRRRGSRARALRATASS
jgi:hypothetical protein